MLRIRDLGRRGADGRGVELQKSDDQRVVLDPGAENLSRAGAADGCGSGIGRQDSLDGARRIQ